METSTSTLDEVKSLIGETLGSTDCLDSMHESTRLLGGFPEMDSLAVAELLAAIEQRFSFEVDDDITIDVLETVGTLAAYVEEHRSLMALQRSSSLRPGNAVSPADAGHYSPAAAPLAHQR